MSKEVTITVKAKFGSKYQEDLAKTALLGVLRAWKAHYNSTLKGNNISVHTFGGEVDDFPTIIFR